MRSFLYPEVGNQQADTEVIGIVIHLAVTEGSDRRTYLWHELEAINSP